MRNQVLEYCGDDLDENDLFLDKDYDGALIGVCFRFEDSFIPAYNIDLIIDKLMSLKNINETQAIIDLNELISEKNNTSFIKIINHDISDLTTYNEDMLFFGGYGNSNIVGVFFKNNVNPIAVYDYSSCVDSLINNDGMDEQDAVEHFEYNTMGTYAGVNTPAILFRF